MYYRSFSVSPLLLALGGNRMTEEIQKFELAVQDAGKCFTGWRDLPGKPDLEYRATVRGFSLRRKTPPTPLGVRGIPGGN